MLVGGGKVHAVSMPRRTESEDSFAEDLMERMSGATARRGAQMLQQHGGKALERAGTINAGQGKARDYYDDREINYSHR